MTKISKHYLFLPVIFLFAFSSVGFGSEVEIEVENDEVQSQAVFNLEEKLRKDAKQSIYDTHKSDRSWHYWLRNGYGVLSESSKAISSVLDVASVACSGIGAAIYGEGNVGRGFIIAANITEVISVALDKIGSRSKKASQRHDKNLTILF